MRIENLLKVIKDTDDVLGWRRNQKNQRREKKYEGESRQQRRIVLKCLKEYLKTKGEEEKELLMKERKNCRRLE